MNRDVRIGDRRLFQIFVHAAAAALIAAFQLDRDARAALQLAWSPLLRRGIRSRRIVRYPFDAVIGDVLLSLFAGRNVFAVALPVDDLRLVPLGVDLNFEVVRRLPAATSWR